MTINIEWARHGSFSVNGFAKTLRGVLTNPIVASILSGSLFGVRVGGARSDRPAAGHDRPGRRADGDDRAGMGLARIRRA